MHGVADRRAIACQAVHAFTKLGTTATCLGTWRANRPLARYATTDVPTDAGFQQEGQERVPQNRDQSFEVSLVVVESERLP